MILAFDTCLDKTYIAFEKDNDIQYKRIESDEKNYHSAYLISTIKEMGFEPSAIKYLIVNCGPGSFTGIRATLSVAKVMAQELNIPVVGLNSCEILLKAGSMENSAVLLDARRSMYYFYEKNQIELILLEKVEEKIQNKTIICDNNTFNTFLDKFSNKFINYEKQNYPLEKVILELGKEKINNSQNPNEEFSCEKLEANYIQTPPIFGKN